MKNVTVRLSEEKVEELDAEADELDMSRAEYIRSLIDSRNESNEVEDELDRARQRAERLERANLLILEDRERTQELEVYVDEQRRRKEAGRLKSWWNDLTGWD